MLKVETELSDLEIWFEGEGSTNRFGQTQNVFAIKINVPRYSGYELKFIRKRFSFLEISEV